LKKLIALSSFILIPQLYATLTVPILYNGISMTPFPHPVQAKVYVPANGYFYVGLGPQSTTSAISYAPRPAYGQNTQFLPLATTPPLNDGRAIEFLTLAATQTNTTPTLGVVLEVQTSTSPPVLEPQMADVVLAVNFSGTVVTESPVLRDASGAVNFPGLPTSGIVGLAGNQFFLFPAIKPCGGNFGSDCNGGIASVAINQSNLALTQVAAQPGDGGIKAALLDPTTPAVLINNSPTIVPNTVDLYWDDVLQRLYIGIQLTTAGTSASGPTCATGTGICNTNPGGTCPTGFFFDNATLLCLTCPSGGIFDNVAGECIPCPTGQQFNPSLGACTAAVCPIGQFFNPISLQCITCTLGWFFDPTQVTCVTCPNGQMFHFTAGMCLNCPSGQTFSPTAGMCVSGPIVCPSGTIPIEGGCLTPPTCPDGFTFDIGNLTCVTATVEALIEEGGAGIPPTPVLELDGSFFLPGTLGLTVKAPDNYVGPRGLDDEITLEVPIRMLTRAGPSGGRSVIVASVDTDGVITFEDIAPDSAFVVGDPNNRMVGVLDVVPRSLAINKVRTMHTSTGPSYLIINGGDGTIATTGNLFFALPLVDDPVNDPTAQGTLADPNSALVNFKFVVPATNNSQLPASTDPAVMIGDGPAPFEPSITPFDIDVLGDTVYISINAPQSSLNESGIIYSQAMFDENGKILRWTPWTKKAFPATVAKSGVSFFAVDALTARVWALDNAKTTMFLTTWDKPTTPLSALTPALNNAMPEAVTAVLDLDQSTRGFNSNVASPLSRYALFGTDNEVVFTRVSQAVTSSLNSPQVVTTDYTLASNLLVTSLPPNASQVQALEYARQLPGAGDDYFFAGTQMGLYVFSVGGVGFDASTLGALNAAPFSTGSWQLAPNLIGSVIDIKTTGNALYVLTQRVGTQPATLYLIPFAPTVATMFAPGNINVLAQAGVGIFSNIVTFNAIQIISTMPDGSTEQIVLATNNGLYMTSRAGGIQQSTSVQANAGWALIPTTTHYYSGIGAMDNASIPVASPSTVWPFYISDPCKIGIFDSSIIQQLAGTMDAGPFNFVPPFFNSIETMNPAFANLPLISYFWSDGARRLMIIDNIQSSCGFDQILSLPFNTLLWDIPTVDDAVIEDPVVNSTPDMYWIKQIGITGILLVGTNMGVIALE